jgi:hypothetical protein
MKIVEKVYIVKCGSATDSFEFGETIYDWSNMRAFTSLKEAKKFKKYLKVRIHPDAWLNTYFVMIDEMKLNESYGI